MNYWKRSGGTIAGGILIGLGLLFLAAQLVSMSFAKNFWPVFVIAGGLLFFAGSAAGGKSASGLVIPGCIITTAGIILLVQNTFDLWLTWSYAWALLVASVGLGLIMEARIQQNDKEERAGWHVIRLGLLFFLIFGAFFEALIGVGKGGGILWAAALITAGIYLIFREGKPSSQENPSSAEIVETDSSSKNFDMVGLFPRDLPTMIAFYRDILRFEVEWDPASPYAEFKHKNIRFAMYDGKRLPELLGQEVSFTTGINGTFELAMFLPHFSDVDREFARLMEQGVRPVYAPRNEPWNMRSSMVLDPEGNIIEIGSWNKD